jgi:hypothetical protein
MKVINLFAGPGAGKSTIAAGIFHLLKRDGYIAEIVTEVAKDMVWEGRTHLLLNNSLYVFSKQYERLRRLLNNNIEFVVTDSPVLLSAVYSPENYFPAFKELVWQVHNQFDNLNFFIGRYEAYSTIGRLQTAEEAAIIDQKVMDTLLTGSIDLTIINQSNPTDAAIQIISAVLRDICKDRSAHVEV